MTEATETTPVVSEAWWETASAVRYMSQLCKHFAHRIPVTLNERDGQMVFSFGTCDATAEDAGLRLKATAPDEEDLHEVERVVITHLQRFAFRDLTEDAAAAIPWVRAT